MIVVADTSIVLNLCRVRHEQLLQQLFGSVCVPQTVADEFARLSRSQARFARLMLPSWVDILPDPMDMPVELREAELDAGETAAIALGLAQSAAAVLMDETLGRAVAIKLGLPVIGIVGILLRAKQNGHIESVSDVLDRLVTEAGFWISPKLRTTTLSLAGE